jgi:hypothetical protein
MARVPVNDKILTQARALLKKRGADRATLRKIINGKVKSVDVDWWRHVNGCSSSQVNARAEKEFKEKLAALEAHTDPARNPNAHERHAAAAALAKVQAAGPHRRAPSAPGLAAYDRELARSLAESRRMMDEAFNARERHAASVNTTRAAQPEAVNTTRAAQPEAVNTTRAAQPEAVNTTRADRHRDRHSSGYMRAYMRRRRALKRGRV